MSDISDVQKKRTLVSVRRAVTLLRCFSTSQPELGVTELSHKLGVHKSTVSRLLSTLQLDGIVYRNSRTGRYRLGIGLLELAGRVMVHGELRQIARPLLRQLSDSTQETVNLAVLERNESINIEQAVPHGRRVLGFGWVGRHTPLHASSTGKVLLAFLPEPDLKQVFLEKRAEFTEHTITDLKTLKAELIKIRNRGYATGLEELEIGLNAVAAPIYDISGGVVAAVSVTGPPSRISVERIESKVADQVVNCAKQISIEIGYGVED